MKAKNTFSQVSESQAVSFAQRMTGLVDAHIEAAQIEQAETEGYTYKIQVGNKPTAKAKGKSKKRSLPVNTDQGVIDLAPAIAAVIAEEKHIDIETGETVAQSAPVEKKKAAKKTGKKDKVVVEVAPGTVNVSTVEIIDPFDTMSDEDRAEIENALSDLKNDAFNGTSLEDGQTIPLDTLKSTGEAENGTESPTVDPETPKGGGVIEKAYDIKGKNHFITNKVDLSTGLDWQVELKPIYDVDGNVISGYNALSRSDNGKTLRVGSESYAHTPNYVFTDTVNKLAEIADCKISGFDEFKGGKTILAYLELKEPMTVSGYTFEDYLTVGNSHDGTTAFFIGSSNRMIRCLNEFSHIVQAMKVRHTKNHIEVGIAQLTKAFSEFQQYKLDLVVTLEEMKTVKIDQTVKAALLERLVALEYEEIIGDRKEISKRKLGTLETIEASIQREYNDLGQNLLGLFNGITHYTTHVKQQSDRTFCGVKGGIYDMNNMALDFCLEHLEIINPLPN